jgi:hypothetical protein
MPASLRDIQTLRSVLGRLNSERPAKRPDSSEGWTPQNNDYHDRGGDFRKRLSLEVQSRRMPVRILVTGQIGVGKSSELLDFLQSDPLRHDGGDSRFSGVSPIRVFCDLEKEGSPERCGPTGVFLTILRDCWAQVRKMKSDPPAEIRDEILTRLVDWLRGIPADDGSQVRFSFGGMDFPISLSDRSVALSSILWKAALHESAAEPPQRFNFAPDMLVTILNTLLDWLASRRSGRSPFLVIDHVDRIRDPDAAEDVLVRAFPEWNRLRASIVMTAPFEYTIGLLRTSVESRWGRPLIVYPLEIPDPMEGQIPELYRAIARSAGLGSLISADALRMLAHYSGGILRMFVQFLAEAAQEARLADHDRIEVGEARSVVFKAEQAYLDYGVKELRLLDQVEQIGSGLAEAATLLRYPIGLLVTEPKPGKPSIQVHPLARTTLGQYRFQRLGATA